MQTVALAPVADNPLDIEVLGRRSLSPPTLANLARHMRDVDHVIAHGSRSLPACTAAQLRSRRRFVVRSIGDAVYFSRSPTRRARVALYLRRAEAIVALWPAAADSLMNRYGVPADRITVIPTGVPAERFPPVDAHRREAARAALGVTGAAPVAACLAWLDRAKGVHVAINAVAQVPELTLLIAGNGPERPALERLAAGVAPGRVRFLGSVDSSVSVLSAIDLFVLPSMSEGLPAVLIEAGLIGVPVVATDVGAVREVIRDDATGVVVARDDAPALAAGLRRGLADGDALAGQLQRHCLDHFEINVVARAWDALLDGLRR